MKEILLFVLKGCPYCKEALEWQRQLQEQFPELAALDIRLVDEREQADMAEGYDYYYVPCYFVGGVKMHEGAATKEKVEAALRSAL